MFFGALHIEKARKHDINKQKTFRSQAHMANLICPQWGQNDNWRSLPKSTGSSQFQTDFPGLLQTKLDKTLAAKLKNKFSHFFFIFLGM